MSTPYSEAWRQVHNLAAQYSALIDLEPVLKRAADAENYLATKADALAEVSALKGQVDQLRQQAQSGQDTLKGVQDEVAKAKATCEAAKQARDGHEARGREARMEIDTLLSAKARAEQELVGLKDLIAVQREALANLNVAILSKSVEFDTAKGAISRLRESLKT